MQFLVVATDYTDPDALSRRMAARPRHFEALEPLKQKGHYLVGGALLGENGQMKGSMLVLDFPSQQDLETRWLQQEPYVVENVWEDIQVIPLKIASLGEAMIASLQTTLKQG